MTLIAWSLLLAPPALADGDEPPNILIITLDDFGRDKLALYEEPAADEIRIPTPTIDGLAADGVVFSNAWAAATCSPTRGTILTGQYPSRNGMTYPVIPGSSGGLDPSLPHMLPRLLDGAGYTAAFVGKWHATSWAAGDEAGPVDAGFDFWTGHIGSFLPDQVAPTPQYYVTPPIECDYAASPVACAAAAGWNTSLAYEPDGVTLVDEVADQYETTREVDQLLGWLDTVDADTPWFAWLSLQAPHSPYVLPPADLLDPALIAEVEAKTGVPYQEGQRFHAFDGFVRKADTYEARAAYAAMVAAIDTELARLLADVDLDTTYVVLMGDNGTPGDVTDEDRAGYNGTAHTRAKQSVYEGGLGVPFIVGGPGLRNQARTSDALVHSADIYTTVLELTGVDPSATGATFDGQSFLPSLRSDHANGTLREFVWSENQSDRAGLIHQDAVRGERYKLITQVSSGTVVGTELYDLWLDPAEQDDLLASGVLDSDAADALDALTAEREALLVSFAL